MNSSISTQARDLARPLSFSLTRLAHTMSPTVPTMSASTSCARILCTCGALDYTLTSGFHSLAISLPQHRKVRRLCFLRTDSCWCLGVLTFMMLSAPGLPRTLTCPHSPSHRHPSLLPLFTSPSVSSTPVPSPSHVAPTISPLLLPSSRLLCIFLSPPSTTRSKFASPLKCSMASSMPFCPFKSMSVSLRANGALVAVAADNAHGVPLVSSNSPLKRTSKTLTLSVVLVVLSSVSSVRAGALKNSLLSIPSSASPFSRVSPNARPHKTSFPFCSLQNMLSLNFPPSSTPGPTSPVRCCSAQENSSTKSSVKNQKLLLQVKSGWRLWRPMVPVSTTPNV